MYKCFFLNTSHSKRGDIPAKAYFCCNVMDCCFNGSKDHVFVVETENGTVDANGDSEWTKAASDSLSNGLLHYALR
jgi:hypothetical protein